MPEGLRAGFPTHWRAEGAGTRRAVLLHCSLAHSGALKGLMARLSPFLNMVAPDLPGHGKSADFNGLGPLQDLVVAIARDFVEEAEGQVDLIGHSFGGTCLLRLTDEMPERVRTLTLIEPPFFDAARAAGDPGGVIAAQDRDTAEVAAAQARGDWEAAARLFTRDWGSGAAWEDQPLDLRQYFIDRMALIAEAGEALNRDYAGLTAPGRLEALEVPVLLVRGDRSPASVAAVQDALAARLPDAREVVIEGAGHMVPVSHPAPVAEVIAEFLTS